MIDDPLQINDWTIKKFLTIAIAIQISMLAIAILNILGITIPVLQQIIGLVYLTFLPGVFILRIMRMHRLGSILALLYTVGLSLTFNMFLGFIINLAFPPIGIAHPLSLLPLSITWVIILGLLNVGAYLRDKDYSPPDNLALTARVTPSILFFILLPLLAILGAQTVNYYDSNVILLVLIAVIALTFIVIILKKNIPVNIYPMAVFSIALALLWHYSFISNHLTGYDIFSEYYHFNQVILNGFWDQSVPETYNAMLSVTQLPVVYMYFLNISGEAIFKVIYPIFYALVPLALYIIFSRMLGSRRGFATAFFFTSVYVFFLIMPSVARQMIAELFFVLLIILIIDKQITSSKKMLFILFSASLVVSHYALSYIFLFFIILSIAASFILKKRQSQITLYSVILFGVICLAWYIFISSSAPLSSLLDIGNLIYQNAIASFWDMFSREDVTKYLATPSQNIIHLINRIVYYLLLFSIAVGANRLLPGRNNNVPREYITFAVGSYALLAACIIVPFFSAALSAQRMFHLAVIILAPFVIFGLEDIIRLLLKIIRYYTQNALSLFSKAAASILLGLFFLFNSGFIFEMVQDQWTEALPLNLSVINKSTRDIQIECKIELRSICPTEQEISAARWLASNRDTESPLYACYKDIRVPSLMAYGLIPDWETHRILPPDSNSNIEQGYIYLGYVNIIYGYGMTYTEPGKEAATPGALWKITPTYPVQFNSIKTYDNGASAIYWLP